MIIDRLEKIRDKIIQPGGKTFQGMIEVVISHHRGDGHHQPGYSSDEGYGDPGRNRADGGGSELPH